MKHPSEIEFAVMAKDDPEKLIELIEGGTLSPGVLTFAAEILGNVCHTDRARRVLTHLLYHSSSPIIREGAIYGLRDHLADPIAHALLLRLSYYDPSKGVQEAASDILDDFRQKFYKQPTPL